MKHYKLLTCILFFLFPSHSLWTAVTPSPETLLESAVVPAGQNGGLTTEALLKGSWGPSKGRGPFWLDLSPGGKALIKGAQSAETGTPAIYTVKQGFLILVLEQTPKQGLPIQWKNPVQVMKLVPVLDSFYAGEALEGQDMTLFNHNKAPAPAQRSWNTLSVNPSKVKTVQLAAYSPFYLTDKAQNPQEFSLEDFASYQRSHSGEAKIGHVGSTYTLLPPGKWLRVLGERITAGVKWYLVNTLLTTSDKGPEEAWVQATAVKALSGMDFMESLPTFKDFAFYLLPEKTKKEIDAAQWVVSPMKHRIDALEAAGKKGSKEYKDLYSQLETALATIIRLDPRVEN